MAEAMQEESNNSSGMEDPVTELNPEVQAMLGHVANSDARIKNQQIGEADLTFDEKIVILKVLFKTKPKVFIERYHKYLKTEDLDCFKEFANEYEINFYINEAKKRLNSHKNEIEVRNRRYQALKRLEMDTEYFKDEEMRARDPLMYEHYIGQYLTQEERNKMRKEIDMSDVRFSTILLDFMDESDVKLLMEKQIEQEDDVMEEEEEEDDDDEEEEEEDDDNIDDEDITATSSRGQRDGKADHFARGVESVLYQPTAATDEEKQMLRQEFMHHMHVRFLEGKDRDFDYTKVDENVEYDSLDIRTQDEQEKYFDEEEPLEVGDGMDLEEKMENVAVKEKEESKDGGSRINCDNIDEDVNR